MILTDARATPRLPPFSSPPGTGYALRQARPATHKRPSALPGALPYPLPADTKQRPCPPSARFFARTAESPPAKARASCAPRSAQVPHTVPDSAGFPTGQEADKERWQNADARTGMKIMKDVLKDRNYTKRRCAGHNAWKCLPPVHHSLPPKGTAYPVQAQEMLTPAPPACRTPIAVTVPRLRQWPVSFLKKAYLPFLRPPAGHIRPFSACIEEEPDTPLPFVSGPAGAGIRLTPGRGMEKKRQSRP